MSDTLEATDRFTLGGVEYPLEPTVSTYIDSYGWAPFESRYTNYVNGDYSLWFQALGKCECGYCDYYLYALVEGFPHTNAITDIVGAQSVQATTEDFTDNGRVLEDWGTPRISKTCVSRDSRFNTAMDRGRNNENRRAHFFTEEHAATALAAAKKKEEEERAKIAHLLVRHPVVPVEGAYIRVEQERLERFAGWTEDGKMKVVNGTETYDVDKVEVLTSVIHGVPHDHVLVMPSSGWRESARKDEVSVVRYNGFNATIRLKDKTTKTIGMNHLALLVPPLNPATEKASAKAARLERELERVKDTLHRRMVAEGVARSWCGEFDPILDSNGLKPRKPKVMIRGVIEFAFEQDAAIAPGTVTKMRNGTHNVGNVVPSDKMRLIEIEQTDPIFTPLLS